MNQLNPKTDLKYFYNISDNNLNNLRGGITKKLLEKYKPKREINIVKPLDRIFDRSDAA